MGHLTDDIRRMLELKDERINALEAKVKELQGPFTCSHDPQFAGGACAACHALWIEKTEQLQKENSKLKLDRRGFQIMSRRIFADRVPKDVQTAAISDGNYQRAGGDAECSICRLPLIEHPQIPEWATFHVVCDGRTVKL